ncbi:hypothetical protein SAMN06298216_0600 [Spirosomataceae bacterium TFI 002]|nr:hypothetical protein SAMN06298216_0600 [Spirosomataceae bacterium TFI 002]
MKTTWLDKYKKKLMPSTAMDKHIIANKERVFKVSGIDITGRDAWYFVLIESTRQHKFLRHEKGDSYNIEDYGKIIISGYGKEVPKEIQQMLRDKYDFDSF